MRALPERLCLGPGKIFSTCNVRNLGVLVTENNLQILIKKRNADKMRMEKQLKLF